jgi:Polyketide cyclase / dehydrase and lipid transport
MAPPLTDKSLIRHPPAEAGNSMKCTVCSLLVATLPFDSESRGGAAMASIRKEIVTTASPDLVWDAIRDLGALHTRLVPGFVVDTQLEPGKRVVTFGNGMIVREPIIDVDDEARRLVWGAEGTPMTHYNSSVQVFAEGTGSRVVWIADFLPHDAKTLVGPMIEQGMAAMKKALDALR